MKNLKFTIWLFALLLVGWTTKAQVNAYSFASSAGTYTEITGGTIIVDGTSTLDSWVSTAITIPAFTFSGVSYTTAFVTSNGILSLGSTAPSSTNYTGISTTTGSGKTICPFNADLDGANTNATTEIRWETISNEVVFQWKQFKRYNVAENFDFQVRLNTVSGAIVFVYRLNSGPGSSTSYQPQVGIRSSSSDYKVLSITNVAGTPTWDAPNLGTDNSATCRFTSASNAKSFTSGLTYTFAPPTCFAPSALVALATTTTTATISWTAPSNAPANGYQYEVRTSGAAGSGATGLIASGNTLAGVVTANINGLTATTTYSVYVHSDCGSSDYSAWTSATSFTTPCDAIAVPYNEGFESITTANTLPACMMASPAIGGKTKTYIASATGTNSALSARTGSKFAAVYYSPEATGGYFFSAPLQLTGGVSYTTSVFYKTDGVAWTDATISYGLFATPAAMTNTIATVANANATSYTEIKGTFTPSTTGVYFVSFRGYNATTAPNYIAFDDFSVTETPACITPTEQPTSLVLTPTAGTISGTYTAAASADSYLVLRTTDATPTVSPVDGTTYTVGNTLGNATIIKAGTGSSFTSTGLIGGTTYYFHVFAMNSTCVNGPKYLTTSPLNGSSVPLLTAPASFTATATSATNINLVTTANTDNNNVILAWNTTSTFGTPTGTYANGDAITGGGNVLYQGAAGNFSHTPLTQGTTYYYKVWSKSGTNYSASGLTANSTTAFGVPYTQNFNASTSLPTGWNGDFTVTASHGTSSSNGLTFNLDGSPATATSFSPFIVLPATPTRIIFDYRLVNYSGYSSSPVATTLSATDKIEFQVSTDNGISYNTFYTIDNSNHTPSTLFVNKIIDISAYTGMVKFKVLGTWGSGDYYVDIDNFIVEEIPSCGYPTALNTGTITTTSAVLNWTAPAEGTPTGYNWIVVARGAGSGAATVANGTSATTTANANGLTSATEYDFFVKTNCSGTLSAWSGPFSFITDCGVGTLPYSQNFESAVVPNMPICTSIENAGLGNNWTTANNPGSGFTSKALNYAYHSTQDANAWFYTQALHLNAGTSYRISFKYGGSSSYGTESLKVAYGLSATSTSMTTVLQDFPSIEQGTQQFTEYDFTPSTSGNYFFGFNAYSIADQYSLRVDDISIKLTPTCFAPTALNVSNILPTGATFSWTAPVNGTPVNYIWKVVASGAAPTDAAIATANSCFYYFNN